jgi:hypothetical protein
MRSARPSLLEGVRPVVSALARPARGLVAVVLVAQAAAAEAPGRAGEKVAAPVACRALASDPAHGLAGNPSIKSARSRIVRARGSDVAHCLVELVYGEHARQSIAIRIGLPLNSIDGGRGGVEGAWNGRTLGMGGGGCAGNLEVTGPVDAGYVGSGTDGGHAGGDCEPGVNDDGTYNLQFINDFIRNGIKQQVLLMKSVAGAYYGKRPDYNYWNGCSTGGRQGYLLAQELPGELDGILANAPALYWTRLVTPGIWGQIVMKELVGGPIAAGKLNRATASAVAACDGADGVADGIIDDPRTCSFSARANVCGAPTAPARDCLTAAEAQAIDRIWDGPRNARGDRIGFGLERGARLQDLHGDEPFDLAVTQLHWSKRSRHFDWRRVTIASFAEIAQESSRGIADMTDAVGNLDEFRRRGGKLLTFVGVSDELINPRAAIDYYRRMAVRYGGRKSADFQALQGFYRLFRGPGVAHCAEGVGPQPQRLFEALVDWVEKGVAPERILAEGGPAGAPPRSRPLCPYPQTAVYNGRGSTDDAASFHCGGNLETRRTVCADVLAKYKDEVDGPLDFEGAGLDRRDCGG